MPRFAAMRRTALALLVASSGCNWVFGLEPTIAIDGGVDAPPLPPGIRTKLVWGVTTSDASGAPGPVVYAPIGSETSRPMVPVISVGAPLGQMPPLTPAPYDISDGTFEIPDTLRAAPHRIVYTLPGETVAHEVQWSVSDSVANPGVGATLVVPRMARMDAALVPINSGYTITPAGLGAAPSTPVLFTTGAYTSNTMGSVFTANGASTTFHYAADASPLTTPVAAPESAKGDVVLLADLSPHSSSASPGGPYPSTQTSIDGFAIAKLDLVAGSLSTPQTEPAWTTTNVDRVLKTSACGTDCIPTFFVFATEQRMVALGALNASPYVEQLQYGVSPSTELPAFVPGPAPFYVDRASILPFLDSSTIDSQLYLRDPTRVAPFASFDRVVTAQIASRRMVSGAFLTSSAEVMTKRFDLTGNLGFDAPLALSVKLGATDLSTDDSAMFPASSQAVLLKWSREDSISTPDDYVVSLYEITSARLAPVRIYHVLTEAVTIDGSLLQPQHQYVFAITARKGPKNAAQGDYTVMSYPFSQTTTFAGAFTVQ